MNAALGANSWGKTGVRLVKLSRSAADGGFMLHDLTVSTELHGDAHDVYCNGDNGKILSTDAQKNTALAFAKEWPQDSLESLALRLAHHFVDTQEPVDRADIEIVRDSWRRIPVDGAVSLDTFEGGSGTRQLVTATVTDAGATYGGGLQGLRLLKATGSEFRGFPRDPYTTGNDVADRVLVTDLDARWTYLGGSLDRTVDYEAIHERVHEALAMTFATVHSKSIQYSMRAMANAVLDAVAHIDDVTLTLPNIHHNVADLSPFGLDNEREVLIPVERTFSIITATFHRDA